MRNWHSLGRMEAAALAMRVFQALAGLAASIVLARGLGVQGLAVFTEVQAWVVLSVALVSSGFDQLAVRTVAARKACQDWSGIAGVLVWIGAAMTAISATAALAFVAYALTRDVDSGQRLLWLMASAIVLTWPLALVLQAATRGDGAILRGQVADFLVRPAVNLSLLFLLFLSPWAISASPWTAMTALLGSTVAAAGVAWVLLGRRIPMAVLKAPRVYERDWKAQYLRLAVIGWVTAFSVQIGLIVLSQLSSAEELADYRIALQIASVALMGTSIVGMQFDPVFAHSYEVRDIEQSRATLLRSCRKVFVMAAIPTLCFIFVGDSLIRVLFGEPFTGAQSPLAVASLGILLSALTGSASNLLVSQRQEHIVLAGLIGGQALHFGLLVSLTPEHGAMGAAIAFAVSSVCYRFFLAFIVWRRLQIVALPISWPRP